MEYGTLYFRSLITTTTSTTMMKTTWMIMTGLQSPNRKVHSTYIVHLNIVCNQFQINNQRHHHQIARKTKLHFLIVF